MQYDIFWDIDAVRSAYIIGLTDSQSAWYICSSLTREWITIITANLEWNWYIRSKKLSAKEESLQWTISNIQYRLARHNDSIKDILYAHSR